MSSGEILDAAVFEGLRNRAEVLLLFSRSVTCKQVVAEVSPWRRAVVRVERQHQVAVELSETEQR